MFAETTSSELHCASGALIPYDAVSFNAGSGVPRYELLEHSEMPTGNDRGLLDSSLRGKDRKEEFFVNQPRPLPLESEPSPPRAPDRKKS